MSEDLLTMPGTLLPENEKCVAPAEHRFAQHPYCVMCDEFHPADGPHESSGRRRVRLPISFSVEQTAANNFRHEVKPGCECLMCEQRRHLDAAFRVVAAYGDTAQFEYGTLSAKEPWIEVPPTELREIERCAETDRHFVYVPDRGPEVWFRSNLGDWFSFRFEGDQPMVVREAIERLPAGHTYLGPAANSRSSDGDFQAMLKAYREQYALGVQRAGEIAELKSIADDLRRAVTDEVGPALLKCQRERDDAVARTFILRDACDRNEQTIAAKDARIAELKSELAAFTIANAAPVAETETPAHNPFRDFPTDPRRMGP